MFWSPVGDVRFLTSPRYLAGDDGALADQVCASLADAGWSCWTTSRQTLLLAAPSQLVSAEWVLPDQPMLLGDLPVAWRVSARAEPARRRASWNAYLTTGLPGEVVVAFALAADAGVQASGSGGPETVVDELLGAGWSPDPVHPDSSVWDPHLVACFTLRALPDGIWDEDPTLHLSGWQAWAEPESGASYLWCAAFSHSTPHALVAAFAAALSAPRPVIRRLIPVLGRRLITVTPT
ncbi:DUF317 domain-containing protein [Actinacidiphila sp. DG2A-62]|uniref:DUF317 domain-containing protein n=1 Tax=Actinacidiphila sp. DG2A-62 TaxID=3108821 RepID=UPI002DB8D060|nr:DUF317 domain-containing protein [Actinacidiphila sp. DG2A-62]MEC3997188.1 DUF317 domain-containing protein [Actinacidiphila sp. DG2A-62]